MCNEPKLTVYYLWDRKRHTVELHVVILKRLLGGTTSQGYNALKLESLTTDVAVNTSMPNLTAMTMCSWVKVGDGSGRYDTLVSYYTVSDNDELVLYVLNSLQLYVINTVIYTSLNVADGSWHSLCVTWDSINGDWAVYDNGTMRNSDTGFQSGQTITGGGTLILGQGQDSLRGGYDPSRALIGTIAYLQIWSRALSADEIAAIDCCSHGDVYTWNVNDLDIKGDARIVYSEIYGDDCPDVCSK
ncbi:neuronal pentraxin-1-like [Glandiceps talaboti]